MFRVLIMGVMCLKFRLDSLWFCLFLVMVKGVIGNEIGLFLIGILFIVILFIISIYFWICFCGVSYCVSVVEIFLVVL